MGSRSRGRQGQATSRPIALEPLFGSGVAARRAATAAAVSVLLALVSGGCVDTAAEPAGSSASIPGDLDVAITASSYALANATIQRGQQVRWVNRDGVTHTVTFDDGPDSGRLSGGSSFIRGFPVAGTFTYHCSIHPAMKGTVTVTP